MKKSIFKVGFLTTLILILAVSCTSPKEEVDEKVYAISSKQKVNYVDFPGNMYELPSYIGALHNASIYEFAAYVRQSQLNPFELDGFSDDMIEAFAYDYLEDRLLPFLENLDTYVEADTIALNMFGNALLCCALDTIDVDYVNASIIELADQYYDIYELGYYDEEIIAFETIRYIAMATNMLWGRDWDFTTPIFENPDPNYMANLDSGGDDNSEDDEAEKKRKEKEDQEKLKQADIQGAIDGAIHGASEGGKFGWIAGAWGAVAGAALGATVASIKEWVHQEMEEAALYMEVDYVVPNSYLYNYLLMLQQTDPGRYEDLYEGKFDDILF